jgi:hypothetical protein
MKAKIETFTATVLIVALISGFVVSAASLAVALETVATLDIQSSDVAFMPASQKTRCIMPPAQQRFCGAE